MHTSMCGVEDVRCPALCEHAHLKLSAIIPGPGNQECVCPALDL